MRTNSPAGRESTKHHAVIPRFRDAFRGFWIAYREESNLRFHIFAAAAALAVGIATGLEGIEALYLGGTVTLVIAMELVNTAVERAVDLAAAGRIHPLAAKAKEVAAGAVLVCALHATAVGAYLFAYRIGIGQTVAALWDRPALLLLPAVALLSAVMGGERSGD